jgi:hypothetical protein
VALNSNNKKMLMTKRLFLISFLSLFFIVGTVNASNSWGKYHWNLSTEDTTTSPLELGNNLNSIEWSNSLASASTDWNLSVLKNQVATGTSNADCDPTSGRVEVCNGEYGDNGWLGIASIWATRGKSNHITQGVVKVNDTYFNTATYNTDAWRNFVMCQEVGHGFGLDHQDENFGNENLGTCMDYTDDPDGTLLGQLDNQHPNQHDYDEMAGMYAHLNDTTGDDGSGKPNKCSPWPSCKKGEVANGADIDLNDPSSWGKAIKLDAQGNNSLFKRDLGDGQVLITHVIWVK